MISITFLKTPGCYWELCNRKSNTQNLKTSCSAVESSEKYYIYEYLVGLSQCGGSHGPLASSERLEFVSAVDILWADYALDDYIQD